MFAHRHTLSILFWNFNNSPKSEKCIYSHHSVHRWTNFRKSFQACLFAENSVTVQYAYSSLCMSSSETTFGHIAATLIFLNSKAFLSSTYEKDGSFSGQEDGILKSAKWKEATIKHESVTISYLNLIKTTTVKNDTKTNILATHRFPKK